LNNIATQDFVKMTRQLEVSTCGYAKGKGSDNLSETAAIVYDMPEMVEEKGVA